MKVHIFLASNFGIVMRGFRCCGILKNRNKILFQSHQLKKNLKKKTNLNNVVGQLLIEI